MKKIKKQADVTVREPQVSVANNDWTPDEVTLPRDATLTINVASTLDATTLLVASTDDLVTALMPLIEIRIRDVLAHVTVVKEWM